MKKKIIALTLSVLTMTTMAGCGSSSATTSGENKESSVKVGMATDAGPIDDKSFNQGTWEGVQLAAEELGVDTKYLKPTGTTEADYLKEIGNLYDAGYKFMVLPGFKFATAVYKAQDKYPDAKFITIDTTPHAGDNVASLKENTASIIFAEHESGFLAGVAASLELQEGDLGFVGGMESPAVKKFNYGFQQGIKYANENLGTNMSVKPENITYVGAFDNPSAGQQIAGQMYDKGVKVIFAAAGASGVGVFTEAKTRAVLGEDVWVIGVDVDQYEDGIYDGEKSVVLTSAMKKIKTSVYEMIQDELNGEFKGGEIITFDAKSNGVGIPDENPNLSNETVSKVNEVLELIKNGEIVVSEEQGDLIK